MMEQNKHRGLSSPKRRKAVLFALLVVTVALLIGGVGGAFASLKESTAPVTEQFRPAMINCTVQETHGARRGENGEVLEGGGLVAYSVTNTGNIPGLVRVAVSLSWTDENGAICADDPSPFPSLDTAGWTKINNAYYFNGYVPAGGRTGGILVDESANELGHVLKVTVLAEIVQATPADAVKDSWGVTFNGSSWA